MQQRRHEGYRPEQQNDDDDDDDGEDSNESTDYSLRRRDEEREDEEEMYEQQVRQEAVRSPSLTASRQSPTHNEQAEAPGKRKKKRKARICKEAGCDKYVVDHGLCIRHGVRLADIICFAYMLWCFVTTQTLCLLHIDNEIGREALQCRRLQLSSSKSRTLLETR